MSLEPGLGFYYGSRLLQPVGDKLGLSIDQVRMICIIMMIILTRRKEEYSLIMINYDYFIIIIMNCLLECLLLCYNNSIIFMD